MNDLITTEQKTESKTKKNRSGLIILCVLIALAVVTGIISILESKKTSDSQTAGTTEKIFNGSSLSSKDFIAVIHIEGVIENKNETYDQAWLLDTIYELTHDKHNTGILLFIDSPGGGVYQSDEVYLELQYYKETSGKPVWAYLGPMAASGGYYIACAADKIAANRNTLTGSIGVIAGQSVDLSELLKKHGIKMNTFTAGRNKDMLNINTPVTEEQSKIMQKIADECYEQFTGIVRKSRKMTKEQVLELADGRIYTANQAILNGLIDRIYRFGEAVDAMKNENDLSSSEIVHYYPKKQKSFSSYLKYAMKQKANNLYENELRNSMPDIPYPAVYFHQ